LARSASRSRWASPQPPTRSWTDVQLLEIRLANGLGGKSFVLMEGTVADVEASVAAGVELVRQEGLLVRQVVIPQLHEQMWEKIL
jgi:microcompartment protein CcmL/EutN